MVIVSAEGLYNVMFIPGIFKLYSLQMMVDSQQMHHHELEVMGLNPGWVNIGFAVLLSKKYLNKTLSQEIFYCMLASTKLSDIQNYIFMRTILIKVALLSSNWD